MAFLQKIRIGDLSQVKLNTLESTILFDFHSHIFGKNFSFVSFDCPKKPLKFILRKFPYLDSVFVTSSNSIGVLFLKDTKIYLTRPVFEQILLKYEQLKDLSVSYDDLDENEIRNLLKNTNNTNNSTNTDIFSVYHNTTVLDVSNLYTVVSINDVNIKKFKENVIFVRYKQIININQYSIQVLPSGTSIGHCNYQITFPNTKKLLVLSSYSLKRRFSIGAAPIESDYLIINRKMDHNFDSIDLLTAFIKKYVKDKSKDEVPLIIPVDFTTFFIELLFHILSLVDYSGVQITIVSNIFTKLDLLLNVHSEWLNNDFFSISEPFPVRKYSNLKIENSFSGIEPTRNLIFCNMEYFELIKHRIDSGFDVLLVNGMTYTAGFKSIKRQKIDIESEGLPGIEIAQSDLFAGNSLLSPSTTCFNLKIEASDEEILSSFTGTVIKEDSAYIVSESEFEEVFVDSRLSVLGNNILLSGTLEKTDFYVQNIVQTTLLDAKPFLKKLLEEDTAIFISGWYVLPKKMIKFRSIGENQIEYVYF